MFRATSTNTSSAILDYCQAGGFGISFDGSGNLSIDVGDGTSTYATVKTSIELNKWYHVVMDFNAQDLTLTVYINGTSLDPVSVNTGYRNPGFNSATTPYISVGSRADSDCYNCGGFVGDIAIANIYADSVTSTQASALWTAADSLLIK